MMDRDGCSSVDGSARLGSDQQDRLGWTGGHSVSGKLAPLQYVVHLLMTEEVELITTWVVVGWVTGDTDKRFFM